MVSDPEVDARGSGVQGLERRILVRRMPTSVAEFLKGRRLAVAGVSRDGKQPANAIFRKLVASGFEVVPVNPNATEVEGEPCYPDLASMPGEVDGVVVATHPDAALSVARECADLGIRHVWFHRSFGSGSVSQEAVAVCEEAHANCIVGGCPLMFCEPVDLGHRCMRWWLQRSGRVPA
jgi:predicted CoA-binding protein